MNISALCSNDKVYVNCECISGIAHKNIMLQVKSAILPVICAIFANLQDYYALFYRIEYLRRTQIPLTCASSIALPCKPSIFYKVWI